MQNRNIYIQWKKTSQKIQIQGVKRHKWRYIYIAGNRVKRYKETPVHKLKGTLQNRVKRYEENPSPWVKRYIARQCQKIQRNPSQTAHRWKTPVKSVHWNRKTPVQRHKKNPSPQVKRYIEESRLKGAKATLMQLKLYKPPPSTKLNNSAAYCYVIGGRKNRVQKEHLSEAG